MRWSALALSLVAVSVVGSPATTAIAQETKHTRGTLTAITADSVTVRVANTDMKFSYDDKTTVQAPGAGTKARQTAEAGKPGPKIADLLTAGQAVEVSYHDVAGMLHATMIRRVSTPGSGGVPGNTSNGKVTAISGTSLTINGSSGGGSTFTQTFAIDSKTRVIGKGLGTKAGSAGGKTAVTDLVHNGDSVSVSFRQAEGKLYASNVRVTSSAAR